MYYCINCKKLHGDISSAEKLFKSGYVLVGDEKTPLGLCKPKEVKELSRSKKSFLFAH